MFTNLENLLDDYAACLFGWCQSQNCVFPDQDVISFWESEKETAKKNVLEACNGLFIDGASVNQILCVLGADPDLQRIFFFQIEKKISFSECRFIMRKWKDVLYV